jgi:predicted MPP superfamily phosphohydrolase
MNRRQFLKLALRSGCAALAAGGYTVLGERYLVRFNRYRVPVPRLPREFQGLRIVHVTDLHYGALVPYAFAEGLVAKINALKGDIVVCTGDYIHERNSTKQIDRIWPLLGRLEAREGVYSVLGNHDHWGDTERSLYWLDRTGQNARGRAVPLERSGRRLWLAGVGDLWEDRIGVDEALKGVPEDECRIVLAHNPDSADTDYAEKVDLMIAGHTHGGQVVVPFYGPPVLPVRNRNYASGLVTTAKNGQLFISRGIGWAIYPVRFNCFPEIPVLELAAA